MHRNLYKKIFKRDPLNAIGNMSYQKYSSFRRGPSIIDKLAFITDNPCVVNYISFHTWEDGIKIDESFPKIFSFAASFELWIMVCLRESPK